LRQQAKTWGVEKKRPKALKNANIIEKRQKNITMLLFIEAARTASTINLGEFSF